MLLVVTAVVGPPGGISPASSAPQPAATASGALAVDRVERPVLAGDEWLDAALATSAGPALDSPPPPSADLLDRVSDGLCAVTSPLAAIRLLGGLVQPVSQVACFLGVLDFAFHTVGTGPDGKPVVRTTPALVGVPTLLDVDGKRGADLVGTVSTAGGLSAIALTVRRAPRSTGPVAASVEVVVADPSGEVGAENVAFGYDERAGVVPDLFRAELDLRSLLAEVKTLSLGVTQQTAGATTDLVAETFDGPSTARAHQVRARLHYGRAPSEAGLTYVLDDPSTLRLRTDRPGPVRGSLALTGERDMEIEVSVADLPAEFQLDLDLASPRILYTGTTASGAPHRIEQLDVRLRSDAPLFGRATQLHASIVGLPSGTELTADTEEGEFSLVATEVIDSVEVFAGSGDQGPEDLPAGNLQGVRLTDQSGGSFVVGARVHGLRAMRARLADTLTVDAVSAGGYFDARIDVEAFTARAVIEGLPKRVAIEIDTASADFGYIGSSPIDRIDVELKSASALIAEADQVRIVLEDVPNEVAIDADVEAGAASLAASAPVGLIEITATSEGTSAASNVLPSGAPGLVLRDRDDEFFLLARVRDLDHLTLATDPMSLTASMRPGQVFVADAVVELAADETIEAQVRVDALPGELRVDLGETTAGGIGSFRYRASAPVSHISAVVRGIELLEGSTTVRAAIHDLPEEVDITLPTDGPLATLDTNRSIGQVRFAIGGDSVTLPARSIAGDPFAEDLFDLTMLPGDGQVRLRFTGIESISLTADPLRGLIRQDPSKARPIDIVAEVQLHPGTEGSSTFEAEIDKPGATTGFSADVGTDQPIRIDLDNSSPIAQIRFAGRNVPGVSSFDVRFDNIPRRMSICLDAGGACQRENSNPLEGRGGDGDPFGTGRPYHADASIDLDDHGTHAPGRFTTVNARARLEVDVDEGPGTEIEEQDLVITDLRFRNLGLDIGTRRSFEGPCTFGITAVQTYAFFDSRSEPFVINEISMVPELYSFKIGTDGDRARAADRIAWLRGCGDGLRFKLDRSSAGTMDCGGRRVLIQEEGGRNNLDLPFGIGQAIPLCGS